MIILTVQIYNLVPTENCYTQYTQLVIYENKLQVILDRPVNQYCDFPSGVLVQLQFADSTLQVAIILNNFDYFQTNLVEFQCNNCAFHQDIKLASVLIDSIQITTFFNVGIILNIKKHQIQEFNSQILLYDDKVCMMLEHTEIGLNINKKQVTLSLSISYGQDIIFSIYYYKSSLVDTTYCFNGKVNVQQFQKAELHIYGFKDGILNNERYQTSVITIVNQPDIIYALSQTVYSNFFFLGPKYNSPDSEEFVKTKNINKVKFTGKYIFESEIQFITGKLDSQLVLSRGNIVCDVTDDPENCRQVMAKVKSQPVSLRKCVFFLDFDSEIIKQEVTKWRTTCFDGAKMIGYRDKVIINLFYEEAAIDFCVLLDGQEIIIKLGYFNDATGFIDSERGFITVKEFTYQWFGKQKFLELKMQKSDNIDILRNQKYTGIFIYDKNSQFMDQVQGVIEINRFDKMVFLMCVCFVISSVICICALFFLVNCKCKKNKKEKKTQKYIEMNEI